MNEVSQSVKLKGVGDSLWVTFDPTKSVDFLQDELSVIFGRLKHLATQSKVILDPGTMQGHDTLINNLGMYLKEKFGVGFVSGPPPKRSVQKERDRKYDIDRSWKHHKSDVLMLEGRIRSGQKITAKKHVVILGDLNPGAEIIAGGDIFVMGSMRGTAVAGQPNNEKAIILALDFRPTQIQIGGYVAAGLPDSQQITTEFAYIDNNAIVVADYLKANPFGRIPWPEVR